MTWWRGAGAGDVPPAHHPVESLWEVAREARHLKANPWMTLRSEREKTCRSLAMVCGGAGGHRGVARSEPRDPCRARVYGAQAREVFRLNVSSLQREGESHFAFAARQQGAGGRTAWSGSRGHQRVPGHAPECEAGRTHVSRQRGRRITARVITKAVARAGRRLRRTCTPPVPPYVRHASARARRGPAGNPRTLGS